MELGLAGVWMSLVKRGFEVESAGRERKVRRDSHFEKNELRFVTS